MTIDIANIIVSIIKLSFNIVDIITICGLYTPFIGQSNSSASDIATHADSLCCKRNATAHVIHM